MTTREKITLVICVLVHALLLYNVWEFDKLTPRIINIQTAVSCPRAAPPPKGVKL